MIWYLGCLFCIDGVFEEFVLLFYNFNFKISVFCMFSLFKIFNDNGWEKNEW